jgi:mRNA interferase MazF
VKRGEIWSVAARGAYTGKPRPAVIVQDDRFDATASVTICALTTDPTARRSFASRWHRTSSTGLTGHRS